MKKSIITIIGIAGFFILASLFFDTDTEFILFFMLAIVSFLLYRAYTEFVKREDKIEDLKEEIETLKNESE